MQKEQESLKKMFEECKANLIELQAERIRTECE